MKINTWLSCVWRVCVSLKFIPMEMIYHRPAYLLILHHWDHMHNMNHKDFSRVVTGFRIQKGNIWECSSKAIKTSGVKMNQLKLEYIRHVKPSTPFNNFFNLALKHLNHVKLLHWKRDHSKETLFVCSREWSFATTSTLYISCINRPISSNFRRNYEHG